MRCVGVRIYPHPVAVRRHAPIFGSPRDDLRKIPHALADVASGSGEFHFSSFVFATRCVLTAERDCGGRFWLRAPAQTTAS